MFWRRRRRAQHTINRSLLRSAPRAIVPIRIGVVMIVYRLGGKNRLCADDNNDDGRSRWPLRFPPVAQGRPSSPTPPPLPSHSTSLLPPPPPPPPPSSSSVYYPPSVRRTPAVDRAISLFYFNRRVSYVRAGATYTRRPLYDTIKRHVRPTNEKKKQKNIVHGPVPAAVCPRWRKSATAPPVFFVGLRARPPPARIHTRAHYARCRVFFLRNGRSGSSRFSAQDR